MIIIDAVRRTTGDAPLAIRCQPYEHKFKTLEPEYTETMTGALGTSALPGRWSISFKTQMSASDSNAAKLVALENKPPEEVVIYWMQFPVVDYAWWRRRAVPQTSMTIRDGILCEYFPAILGVVTVKQTSTDGCYKEFEVVIEETRRLPEAVAPLVPQQTLTALGFTGGARYIYAQINPTANNGNPLVVIPATVPAYNQFLTNFAGVAIYREWVDLSDGSIALDSGWLNSAIVA